jgi:hypothetical protein
MRPRSPAARNAFKNQISSLVKLSVMMIRRIPRKTIAARDVCFPFLKHEFSCLKFENSCFCHAQIIKKFSSALLIARIVVARKSSTRCKRAREKSLTKRADMSKERASDLARQCTELVRKGNDLTTIWSTLLRRHLLVDGIPRERLERSRSVSDITLITGERLVFDADFKEFRIQ